MSERLEKAVESVGKALELLAYAMCLLAMAGCESCSHLGRIAESLKVPGS